MGEKYDGVLLLDEEDYPILIEEECAELKPIVKDFMSSWAENKDRPINTIFHKRSKLALAPVPPGRARQTQQHTKQQTRLEEEA